MLLAETMFHTACRSYGAKLRGFSDAAQEAMLQHDWPGNVRELQNTIERAVILAEANHLIEPKCLGLIHPNGADLKMAGTPAPAVALRQNSISQPGQPSPEPSDCSANGELKSLEVMEREHILRALEETKGNRTQAANLLKISIRTLRNKLNEYKMECVAG